MGNGLAGHQVRREDADEGVVLLLQASDLRRQPTTAAAPDRRTRDSVEVAATAASVNPPSRTLRRDSRVIDPSVSDQPAMARSGCGNDLFEVCGPSTAPPYGSGQQFARDGVHLVEGHRFDLGEGVGDGAVLAVVQLAAADPVHPGTGILETEHQSATQRALRDPAFGLGDAVAGHRPRAHRRSPGRLRRNAPAGTRRRSTGHRCRRRCPPSNRPSTPTRVFPESVGTDANSARRPSAVLSTDSAHRCSQCRPGVRTPSDRWVCSASLVTSCSVGRPVTRPVPLRGGTDLRPRTSRGPKCSRTNAMTSSWSTFPATATTIRSGV